MSSDVNVNFSADTKGLRDDIESAQRSVSDNLLKIRVSADASAPAFARLEEAINRLTEVSERNKQATEELVVYADWAFYLGIASAAAAGLSAGLSKLNDGATYLKTTLDNAQTGIFNLTVSYLEYARSQAYVAQYLPIVRVEMTGLVSIIGRVSLAWQDMARASELVKSGLIATTGAAISASGGIDRLARIAQQSGLESASGIIQRYMVELGRVPGMTKEVSSSIVSAFGSIPNSSQPLLESLVGITSQMSSSKEQAQALAEQLTQAMTNPASSGEAFLASQRDITAELLKQFDAAKRNNDIGGMQAIIIQEMIQKERAALEERTRALKEHLRGLEQLGPIGRLMERSYKTQVEEALKALDALNKQTAALDQAAQKLRQLPPDMNQTALAARDIVNAFSPLANQLDAVNGKLSTMRQIFGGFGGELKGATGNAAQLIMQFEGFRDRAYADNKTSGGFSAWRVGYGSDTKTNADGTVERVNPGTTVTREDAERDLARRVVEFQREAAAKIGPAWETLSDRAKASITSVVYNYGANTPVLNALYTAAGTGSDSLIAAEIRKLGANPDRRYQEAANIENAGPGANLSSGRSPTKAEAQAIAAAKDEAQRLTDAMAGGNAVAQAQAQILKRNAEGQRDSVKDAQLMVQAWQEDLKNANSTTLQVQMQNGLKSAQVTLSEKLLEVEKSKLSVAGADDTSAKEKLATARKLYDLEMKAAGGDVALQSNALMKKKAAEQAYEQEVTRLAQEAENTRYAIASAQLDQRKIKLREDLQSHNLSSRQKLEASLALESEQTRLETEHYQKLRDLEDQGTVAYQQAQNKMTLIAAESATRRQQIMLQDGRRIQQDYDRVFNQLGSSLTSSIMGMVQGTMTLRDAFRNLALQIVQMFVKAGVDMLMNWAASQAKMLMSTTASQAAQTGAVAAGAASRLATQASGAAAGVAIDKSTSLLTISGDAAKAAAGAYSAVAGIPLIGPVLAPVAAATAFTAVSAFGSFDTGSWSIPHDQLAMVHAGEMIVPSRGGIAEQFRGMMDGDSRGSNPVNVHFNVSAVDASGVSKFFKKNSHHIVGAVSEGVRSNSHLRHKNMPRG